MSPIYEYIVVEVRDKDELERQLSLVGKDGFRVTRFQVTAEFENSLVYTAIVEREKPLI